METTDRKVRVLIVGCGMMGQAHVGGWKDSGLATVEAVSDVDATRLAEFAKKHEIPRTGTDYAALIDEVKPDVVSVCVPACFHPAVTKAAAAAGCHVFCEKPIALSVAEAEDMIAACAEAGVLLAVDFMRRFWGNTQLYKELVSAPDGLGRPIFWKRQDVRGIRYFKLAMHEKGGNGGSIVDCSCHWVDQWCHVLQSDPVRVYARGAALAKGKPGVAAVKDLAVETGIITIDFASGDVGEITMCWGLPPDTKDAEYEFAFGPRGWVRRDGLKMSVYSGKWERHVELTPPSFTPICAAVAKACLGQGELPTTGQDGLRALKVALAALESIETGQPVDIE